VYNTLATTLSVNWYSLRFLIVRSQCAIVRRIVYSVCLILFAYCIEVEHLIRNKLHFDFISGTLQLHYEFRYCHNLSSVTRVYCDKTAEARITQFH